MAIKTISFLKNQNRDFNNVLDSFYNIQDGLAPVALTPAATVTLNKADHAGRLLLVPSTATANDSYILPTASAAGETYNLAWSGVAADTDNVIFRSSAADGLTFTGGVLQFDTDEGGAAIQTIAYPGGDDDKLTITNVQNFNLTFTATAATVYHVTGYAASTDTATAFGDQ
tara:strand:- start:65 stop:577 length:513 start_codon:yes stop_codon:yes gene_type:complete